MPKHPRASKVCRVLRHSFGVVEAQRTSSNLHAPHHHRASKVPSHIEHCEGVVRVGALCLNHPELVLKHPTHLARAVRVWFV